MIEVKPLKGNREFLRLELQLIPVADRMMAEHILRTPGITGPQAQGYLDVIRHAIYKESAVIRRRNAPVSVLMALGQRLTARTGLVVSLDDLATIAAYNVQVYALAGRLVDRRNRDERARKKLRLRNRLLKTSTQKTKAPGGSTKPPGA